MPRLIEPLEEIAKSDLKLVNKNLDFQNLIVGKNLIENGMITICHIGPDNGFLDIEYKHGQANGGKPVAMIRSGNKDGVTYFGLLGDKGITYMIHHTRESLPDKLHYENVPWDDYRNRNLELMR